MWYQAFTLLLGTAWLFWIKVWLFCSGLRLYLPSQNATTFLIVSSYLRCHHPLTFCFAILWGECPLTLFVIPSLMPLATHFISHSARTVPTPHSQKVMKKKNSGKYIQVLFRSFLVFPFLRLLFHYTSGPFPAHSPFSTSHTTPRPSLVRLNYNPRSLRAPLWLAECKRAPTP